MSHTTMEDVGEAVLPLLLTKVCSFSFDDTTTFDICFGLVGRKRRRSTSPYDRDRYDPRPRYDDYGLLLLSNLASFSVSHLLLQILIRVMGILCPRVDT